MSEKDRHLVGRLAMIPLGIVFILAGMGKLLFGQVTFALPFIPQALMDAVYTAFPYIELVVGCLLIIGFAVKFTVSLSALLIIGFAVVNIVRIMLGAEDCASCFGGAVSFTPTFMLLLDGLMAMLVLIILFCHRGAPWWPKIVQEGVECKYV